MEELLVDVTDDAKGILELVVVQRLAIVVLDQECLDHSDSFRKRLPISLHHVKDDLNKLLIGHEGLFGVLAPAFGGYQGFQLALKGQLICLLAFSL